MSNNSDGIRIMQTSFDNMQEVIPGLVYMKHIYGADTSVALFRFICKKGEPFPVPRHSHGEEVGYIIKGEVTINGVTAGPGDVMLIPGGVEHGADGIDLEDGEELVLLSIVTPPRYDYGPEEGGGKLWQEEQSR